MTHTAIDIAPGITRYIAMCDPEDAPRKIHKVPLDAYLPFLAEWRSVAEFAEHFKVKQNYASFKLNALLDMEMVECERRNVGSTRVNYYRRMK